MSEFTLFLAAKQDVVNECHIARGDVAVTILVGIDNPSVVIVENDVVEQCDVGRGNVAVTVHVARKDCWAWALKLGCCNTIGSDAFYSIGDGWYYGSILGLGTNHLDTGLVQGVGWVICHHAWHAGALAARDVGPVDVVSVASDLCDTGNLVARPFEQDG